MRLLAASILLISQLSIQAQDSSDILKSFYDKVSNGNFDNWKDIESAYFEEETYYNDIDNLNFLAQSGTSLHKVYKQWPDLYVNELYIDSTLLSVYYSIKNARYYVLGNMPPQKLNTGAYGHEFEFEPMMVYQTIQQAKSIKFQGVKDYDSGKCYHLKVDTKSLIWHFYFNVETNLLDYWSNSPDGIESTLTKVYNYKAFENLLIPMSENKTKNGVLFYLSDRKNLKLNIEIDKSKFDFRKSNR